jgi:hypothetical protein
MGSGMIIYLKITVFGSFGGLLRKKRLKVEFSTQGLGTAEANQRQISTFQKSFFLW